MKIERRNAFPEVNLAPQVLINCRGGGTCQVLSFISSLSSDLIPTKGGTVGGVYRYIAKHGLPDESCQNYQARDNRCEPHGVCEKCEKLGQHNTCSAVDQYRRYFIEDFGHVNGGGDYDDQNSRVSRTQKIMAEIYFRGPVSCEIFATKKFDNYTGGIFRQVRTVTSPSHFNLSYISA